MARFQCNACGAIYDDVTSDGVRYFHACPPLAPHEARTRIASGAVTLTDRQARQLAALDAPPADGTAGAADPSRGDAYLAALALRRPGHRDENLDRAKLAAAPKDAHGNVASDVPDEALMRAVGAGVTPLDAAADGDA